ncbi:GerAB/ArcD/ProY family transporter [Clostridium thailandense]|uniref:GerAB/ArcD/ProY family transporter n=1 Tax=Clostridium thailandense TaxID=2794346 RepID=UPI003988BA0C
MNRIITNRQISLMVYCITVGYGIIDLPSHAAEGSGTGAWFSLLTLAIIFVGIICLITYLQYIFQGRTLYEYGQVILGKFTTYIIISIYIIYFFINFSMIGRLYTSSIGIIFLVNTPTLAIIILFYIVVLYALIKGINTISRLCELYGILNIVGFLFINLFFIMKGKFVHIQPLFVSQDLSIYFKGIFKNVFAFLGLEILFTIPFNKKDNEKVLRYTTFIMIVIGILYISIVESTISVTGVDIIVNYELSLFNVIRAVDTYYLEFLRRFDGIFMIYWSMNIVCAVCLWGYGVVTFTSKIAKNINYKYITVATTIVAVIVGLIPKTKNQAEEIIKYNSYLGVILNIVVITSLLIIIRVKKDVKKI